MARSGRDAPAVRPRGTVGDRQESSIEAKEKGGTGVPPFRHTKGFPPKREGEDHHEERSPSIQLLVLTSSFAVAKTSPVAYS